MHTLMVIGGGLVLLAAFVVAGRIIGGPEASAMAQAARYFILLWFIAAALNMYVGVSRAGYSVAQELPIFFVVFGVPAAVAFLLSFWLRK
jgi:hypothetical protein